MGLSASFFMVSAPSDNTVALEAFMRNILVGSEVSIAKMVDIVLACEVWVYNSYNLVWMAPRMIYCCCSNCSRVSIVTSLNVSLISCKSPSINVIGSREVLVALDFFLDSPFSRSLRL